MTSPKKIPARSPRSTITIERLTASYETSMLGAHATRVMATVAGVSGIRIEDQYIDLAMLSYVWAATDRDSAGIDRDASSSLMAHGCPTLIETV